jgi:hypothetical protein
MTLYEGLASVAHNALNWRVLSFWYEAKEWSGLWWLTPLSSIFQLYRGGQLFVEETGVPGENNRLVASNQCCIEYTSPGTGFALTTLVVICTDCTGSCKSNYHTITTTTAPTKEWITKMVIKQLGQISRSFSSYFFLYSGNSIFVASFVCPSTNGFWLPNIGIYKLFL